MKIKKEKLITYICLGYILINFIYISYHFVHSVLNKKQESNVKNINFEEIYPFDIEENIIDNKTYKDKYVETFNNLKSKIENKASANFPLTYELSETYCKITNKLGISKILSKDNDVLLMDNGFLGYEQSKVNVEENIDKIRDFQDYLKINNIDFLYVSAPYKIIPTNDRNTYNGYIDYSKNNIKQFIYNLDKNNINYLDLQEYSEKSGINMEELFFKTDHHWKVWGALWGAEIIAKELNNNYSFNIDTSKYNIKNFNIEIYKESFLGSAGKKTTLSYGKPDDFEYIVPKYNTNYEVYIPSLELNINGSFEETLIYNNGIVKENYPKKEILYTENSYGAYGYGDRPLIKIKNNNIIDNKKVLILKDSFGDTAVPFLSLGLSNISAIDLRHFTGSLKKYIEEYKPNIVIFLKSGVSSVSEDYEQHKNIYDYR